MVTVQQSFLVIANIAWLRSNQTITMAGLADLFARIFLFTYCQKQLKYLFLCFEALKSSHLVLQLLRVRQIIFLLKVRRFSIL